MAQIINLRTRRKQSARDTARTDATARAARHGISKAERDLTQARTAKADRDLDGHKRSPEAPQNS